MAAALKNCGSSIIPLLLKKRIRDFPSWKNLSEYEEKAFKGSFLDQITQILKEAGAIPNFNDFKLAIYRTVWRKVIRYIQKLIKEALDDHKKNLTLSDEDSSELIRI